VSRDALPNDKNEKRETSSDNLLRRYTRVTQWTIHTGKQTKIRLCRWHGISYFENTTKLGPHHVDSNILASRLNARKYLSDCGGLKFEIVKAGELD
jgi:hypothetical protein